MTAQHVLLGEFVNLRPLRVADADITFCWLRGARGSFLNEGPESVEEQADWISSRPPSEYNFIIELKDARPIGMLSLVSVDERNRRAESSRFLIGAEEAAKGVPAAVEAMKLLYEFAFDTLRLERVYGTIAVDNWRMVKWQKFLGMREEGRLRRHYFMNGEFQDAIFLGIFAQEYRAVTLPRMRALLAAGRPPLPI